MCTSQTLSVTAIGDRSRVFGVVRSWTHCYLAKRLQQSFGVKQLLSPPEEETLGPPRDTEQTLLQNP